MAFPFVVVWNEDSSATALGRLTARNGSGAATGVNGEGNWLKQADVSTITCAIFDVEDNPTTASSTPTVTIASSILDAPVTTNVLWTLDATGYNFIHDLPATSFPTGGNTYDVEYKVALMGGSIFFSVYSGKARAVRTS